MLNEWKTDMEIIECQFYISFHTEPLNSKFKFICNEHLSILFAIGRNFLGVSHIIILLFIHKMGGRSFIIPWEKSEFVGKIMSSLSLEKDNIRNTLIILK